MRLRSLYPVAVISWQVAGAVYVVSITLPAVRPEALTPPAAASPDDGKDPEYGVEPVKPLRELAPIATGMTMAPQVIYSVPPPTTTTQLAWSRGTHVHSAGGGPVYVPSLTGPGPTPPATGCAVQPTGPAQPTGTIIGF